MLRSVRNIKNKMYSDDNDKTEGAWIYFEDGHKEFWNNMRLEAELKYRGLQLLKTQTRLARKELINSANKVIDKVLDEAFEKMVTYPLVKQTLQNEMHKL